MKAIFEPEYGIWGVDDSRAKLSGGDRIDPISGAKIFNLLNSASTLFKVRNLFGKLG